jgi:hypothetical protein
VGKSCPEPTYNNQNQCFGGSCAGVDAAEATVEPYCTRDCGGSNPACPSGYECVEDVVIKGSSLELCLLSP